MNEEQQIIDILINKGEDLCEYIGEFEEAQLDYELIKRVAHEITAIFKPSQKDTRSKRERALDVKFGRMGVKPRVYHFTDLPTFKALTIATIAKEDSYAKVHTYISMNYTVDIEPATSLLKKLKDIGIYGVAICDKRDHFNKRTGRMKAKGRLLQHLLKDGRENK